MHYIAVFHTLPLEMYKSYVHAEMMVHITHYVITDIQRYKDKCLHNVQHLILFFFFVQVSRCPLFYFTLCL